MWRRLLPPFLPLLLAPLLLSLPSGAAEKRDVNSQLNLCAACHADATCQQKDGKDVCICNYGFLGNGITYCQDKDECQLGTGKICGAHASCHNTHGSFYCTCLGGYQASSKNKIFIPNDGTLCADINECEVSGICGLGGRCVNTAGSYECYCTEGYSLENGTEPFHPPTDRRSCKVVDCGSPPSLPHADIASVNKTTYGSKVVYSCWPGYVIEHGNWIAICNSRREWEWEGGNLLCKEVDCGKPPLLPNTHIIWDNSTTLGSRIYYTCREGFQSFGGSNFSQCTITQKWEKTTFECKEINCGNPPLIPHSNMTWDNTSQLGSVVKYKCIEDFIATTLKSTSRCTRNGSWEILDLRCEKMQSFIGVALKNSCLTWRRHNRSTAVNETYWLTMRMLGSKSVFTDELLINFTTPEKNVTVCLPIREDANYSFTVTEKSTNMLLQASITQPVIIEKEVIFGNTSIYNSTCVKWQRKSKRKQSEETYIFHIQGQRWYQKQFHHKTILNFTTDSHTPEFCLNGLPPGSNFTVNISTANLDHKVLVFMTTPISEPQSPEVEFISVQGSIPLFTLKKAEEINGPISSYQVIVVPWSAQCNFACYSLSRPTYFSKSTDSDGYVTAEFPAEVIADNTIVFALGDRLYYGNFYNAPLKQGKDYCIILRTVSEWNEKIMQSCVAWAEIKALLSPAHHVAVVLLGSVAVFCSILLLSLLAACFCS
ncbi:sushi domain-containing protein 1 [Tiliqua scincoides]|uniref:sushi domain-containing protein 1 n=1 Tax=Tiliqua scincoides TaxID=71010 RepID=UPI0034634274